MKSYLWSRVLLSSLNPQWSCNLVFCHRASIHNDSVFDNVILQLTTWLSDPQAGPPQTYDMENVSLLVKNYKPLTIIAKHPILDVCEGRCFASNNPSLSDENRTQNTNEHRSAVSSLTVKINVEQTLKTINI